MNIFTDNPVLAREVRGRLRWKRKGSGRVALWVAWPLGLFFTYFYARGLIGIVNAPPQDARDFWPLVTNSALGLIVLLAPALAATAITQEREQQTWETLATTQLSAAEVLLGKWIGRQLIPWLIIVFLTPFLVVCAACGGMSFWILPMTLLFLLITTGFYTVLGLLCSFFNKRTAGATATALTLTALLCIGTVVINGVIALLFSHAGPSSNSSVMWLNPFFVLNALGDWLDTTNRNPSPGNGEPNSLIVLFYLLVSPLAVAAALRFMIARYRQAVQG